MNIESQKVFLTLAENLNFTRTAQECFMAPSTLTRLIQRMEEEVGYELLERDNRRVRLTPIGEVFREYAEKSIADWKVFRHAISERFKDLSGTLRLYCSVTASYTIVDQVLSLFRKKYPQIKIKLSTGRSENSFVKVLEGEADIAIGIKQKKVYKNLVQRAITISPLRFIVARKPLFDPKHLSPKSISWKRVPFIIQKRGETRKRLGKWFRQKKIKPLIYSQVTGNEAAFALVSMGFGVGVFSDLFLNNNRKNRKIQILEAKPDLPPYSIVMCASKRGFNAPVVQAFWNETDVSFQ